MALRSNLRTFKFSSFNNRGSSAAPAWFNRMSSAQQQSYLRRHPNSKFKATTPGINRTSKSLRNNPMHPNRPSDEPPSHGEVIAHHAKGFVKGLAKLGVAALTGIDLNQAGSRGTVVKHRTRHK